MAETIVLKIPAERRFREVASLVLGGIGTRFDLPYERTDDVQLAVFSMLEAAAAEEATVEMAADGDLLSISVGPLRPDAPADEGLRRVLRPLADSYELQDRDGQCWATMVVERTGRSPA